MSTDIVFYQFLQGKVLYHSNKFLDAKSIFMSLTKLNPNHVASLYYLGISFYKINQLGPAIACISKCIATEPHHQLFKKTLWELYKDSIRAKNLKTKLPLSITSSISDLGTSTTCVILCGGEASRWNNYKGIKHKQLIEVNGEILLKRTLRQVSLYSPTKIAVVVPPGDANIFEQHCGGDIEIYEVNNTIIDGKVLTPAWKYLSSKHLWNKTGITISLLGDVWFSDFAIDKIFQKSNKDWITFGRSTSSEITGCPYEEIFAHQFTNFTKHQNCLELLDDLYKNGVCNQSASGWALVALMSDDDPNLRTVGEAFYEIDDFTEDFDFPSDYENWIRKYTLAYPSNT